MAWNPNSNKHKATHCGYKQKPTKGQVSALLGLYQNAQLNLIEDHSNQQLNLFD